MDTVEQRFSHAVVLSRTEAENCRLANSIDLARVRTTALRGPVGLVDAEGLVFGHAVLASVNAHGDAESPAIASYVWELRDLTQIPSPFAAQPRLLGPLWMRLDGDERRRLAGALHSDAGGGATELGTAIQDRSGDGELHREPGDLCLPTPEAETAEGDRTSQADSDGDEPFAVGDVVLDDFTSPGVAADRQEQLTCATPAPPTVHEEPMAAETVAAATPNAGAPQSTRAVAIQPHPAADAIDPDDIIAAARERAMAMVPEQVIDEHAARRLLIELREGEIKATFPGAKPTAGILRKTLLDRLIEEAVESEADFERLIPREIRMSTDQEQLAAYLTPIVRILAKIG